MSLIIPNFNVNTDNFFQKGIVSGDELAQVTSEILSKAPVIQNSQTQTNLNASLIFGSDSTVANQQIKLAATNISGYDVNLSNNAISSIQSLNTIAAASLAKNMDGKVYFPSEFSNNTSEFKSVFFQARPLSMSDSASINKDKKGSGSSYSSNSNKKGQRNVEGLNLVA